MITFGVHAPSQDAFWSTWIAAGIATEPGVLAPSYADCIDFSSPSNVWA